MPLVFRRRPSRGRTNEPESTGRVAAAPWHRQSRGAMRRPTGGENLACWLHPPRERFAAAQSDFIRARHPCGRDTATVIWTWPGQGHADDSHSGRSVRLDEGSSANGLPPMLRLSCQCFACTPYSLLGTFVHTRAALLRNGGREREKTPRTNNVVVVRRLLVTERIPDTSQALTSGV